MFKTMFKDLRKEKRVEIYVVMMSIKDFKIEELIFGGLAVSSIILDADSVVPALASCGLLSCNTWLLKSELGLPKGFGKASKYTNGFSYDLKGKWEKLPFRAPTLVGGSLRYTSDFGLTMSRNIFTPTGYMIG